MKNNSQKTNQPTIERSDMKFHLTKEGSLGILAYGDLAVKAWKDLKKGD